MIVSMVGFFKGLCPPAQSLRNQAPLLGMCVLDGPWSLQAARRANCNWVLHRRPLLLRLLGATYLLPCPPTQQVLQHQPHFLHLSQYLCLHFAIVVDEYFKYSACLPPTNLPARCVPTNKTGATSNATKTVSSPANNKFDRIKNP